MTMDQSENGEPTVGARYQSEGYLGTIKYIGQVPPTKGEWLGVDWDDPERGKHNGTHEGTQYFTTTHPTSGSFIRPKKADLGIQFVRALRERYGLMEDEMAGVIEEEMFVKGSGNQVTTVEVVGAHSVNVKQSKLSQLHEVSLRGQLINGSGPEGDIQTTCPNIAELDISQNLFVSWKQVSEIVKQLTRLKVLNVSENHLSLPDSPRDLSDSFIALKTLFANRMKYDWEQLQTLSVLFPALEILHVCFNQISVINIPPPDFEGLKLLNLESNPVQDWQQILNLGGLSNLHTLILNNTGIDRVCFPDCSPGGTTSMFPKLKELSLYHNKLSEWDSINELAKLPCLENLKISHNPLTKPTTEMTEDTIFYIIIAKIKLIKTYNRTTVTEGDRRGAELDYMKLYGTEWKKAGGDQDPQKNNPSEEFKQHHPRYQALIQKYGPPEDSELVKITSALKNNLINVTITCPQRPEKKDLKKKLPLTMTVQKLRAMLQRVYRGDPVTTKLTYISPQMENQEVEFENDMREIGFYSVEEGDTIYVKW